LSKAINSTSCYLYVCPSSLSSGFGEYSFPIQYYVDGSFRGYGIVQTLERLALHRISRIHVYSRRDLIAYSFQREETLVQTAHHTLDIVLTIVIL